MTYPSTNYEHHPQDNQQRPKYDIQKLAINGPDPCLVDT